MWHRAIVVAIVLAASAFPAFAQELPRGTVIERVATTTDATQTYALYLPKHYSPDRRWPVLIGFHPGGRGRAIVEKYQAAAEQYGYVVAASNNSRNGPWTVSIDAINAMVPDLERRFSLDPQRVYLTGHSGGARVATAVALSNPAIAGVIASSGGFPDSQPRKNVSFAIFGTAGIDDFNYLEMRMLDRKLTTPHRLAVFDGGHTLPPDDVALEAIEWMELQAIKAKRRASDAALVERLFEKRLRAIAEASGTRRLYLVEGLVADFTGLRDVSAEAKQAKALAADSEIKKALSRERSSEDRESRTIEELAALEASLADDNRRSAALLELRSRLSKLAEVAAKPEESPDRTQARRLLRTLTAGAGARVTDREYLAFLESCCRNPRMPFD